MLNITEVTDSTAVTVISEYLDAFHAAYPAKPIPSHSVRRGWFYIGKIPYRKTKLMQMTMSLRRLASDPHYMVEIEKDKYSTCTGFSVQRESGLTSNGNPFKDRWVLRNPDGLFVDLDQYRSDLFDRHMFKTL